MARSWRALALFWVVVLASAGGGAAALQYMGPPTAGPPTPSHTAEPPRPTPSIVLTEPPPPPEHVARRATDPAAIAAPDPALLEPASDFPAAKLPRIAPDGRTSMRVYARPADRTDRRPRIGLLVAGIGLNAADSRAASDALPPEISLGLSPYTRDPDALLDAIRTRGHEFLVTLPMESAGYPMANSGPHALMTGIDSADNARQLEWVLSRMQGEVGLTGASDGLRGERFAASTGSIGPVLRELARRGLLYIDPRPGTPVSGAVAAVTVVVDDALEGASIDAGLAALEQQARNGSAALGVVLRPRPAVIERVAAWARALDARGISLVPVSALVPR